MKNITLIAVIMIAMAVLISFIQEANFEKKLNKQTIETKTQLLDFKNKFIKELASRDSLLDVSKQAIIGLRKSYLILDSSRNEMFNFVNTTYLVGSENIVDKKKELITKKAMASFGRSIDLRDRSIETFNLSMEKLSKFNEILSRK